MYPPQQPAPPARRRKKPPNKTLLMVLVSVLGVLALCLVTVVVYGVTSDSNKKKADAATSTAAATDAAAENGIPPTPNPEAWKAYIDALRAIDPDIVGKKDESTIVDRGRSQCTSVKDPRNDQAKLIELTNRRFTSPSHPQGFGDEKSTQILAAVRKYICPTY